MKYDKFWNILLEHFVDHKLLISKEWEGRAKEAGLVGYLVSLGGVNLALRGSQMASQAI